MMWDQIIARVIEQIENDPTMAQLFGDRIRAAQGSSELEVPLLEWMLIGDTEDELWAPTVIQFDLWNATAEDNRLAEARLRAMYHQDLPIVVGGLMMWAQYNDGSVLAEPDRSGFIGRALRFRFTPLRRGFALRS